MGDVVMRTAVLREVRKAFPNAKLSCIVDPIGRDVLSLGSIADELIVVDRRANGIRYFLEKCKVHAKVFGKRFDLLIDLYGGASSRSLARLSNARDWLIVRDFTVTSKHPLACNFTLPPLVNTWHLTSGAFQILRFFDYEEKSTDFLPSQIYPGSDPGVSDSPRLVLLRPHYFVTLGSGDPRKHIPAGTLVELIKWIYAEHSLMSIIIGNPGQQYLQSELSGLLDEANLPHECLSSLTLSELSNTLRGGRFLISPDTGLLHFALALRKPVLGVFMYNHPLLVDPLSPLLETCFRVDIQNPTTVNGLPVGTQDLASSELIDSCRRLLARTGHH
jgi:ADP-heptose:LPS heptosyltransferase